jgi:hypothetical protein
VDPDPTPAPGSILARGSAGAGLATPAEKRIIHN